MRNKHTAENNLFRQQTPLENLLITSTLLLLTTGLAFVYWFAADSTANIPLFYVAALVLVARFTTGYLPGILASIVGVACVNFFFTYPAFALNFTITGYPLTFAAMLLVSLTTSAAATHLKTQAKALAEHEKLLAEAEKEKMKANLLRAISHDLRTPLTGIIGCSTSYLENGKRLPQEEKTELVRHIDEDARWLLHMVENLLSVTRIQNETSTVKCTPELVEEVAAEAVARFRKRYPQAQVQVSVPDEPVMVPMDAVLIEQVIINLLENAAVHGRGPSPISLTVTRDPESVVFAVRDYGKGIPLERLETIFDAASSEPRASVDGRKGMGIGLSICKTIILAHRGSIQACNKESGAEFSFRLPREEEKHETKAERINH